MTLPEPYYQDDAVTLYHSRAEDVLPHLSGVDCVIGDPPYSPQAHAGARNGTAQDQKVLIDFASMSVDTIRDIFSMCADAGARWIVATVDTDYVHPLKFSPPRGVRFVRHGVWVKPNGIPQFTGDRPGTGWEAVAILHREGGKMRWNGGGRTAVFTHNTSSTGDYPTQKPPALISEFVQLFSNPGELVLDPTCGSGTTCVVAKQLGRRAIGIDMRKEALDIAVERLRQASLFAPRAAPESEQQAMFGGKR